MSLTFPESPHLFTEMTSHGLSYWKVIYVDGYTVLAENEKGVRKRFSAKFATERKAADLQNFPREEDTWFLRYR